MIGIIGAMEEEVAELKEMLEDPVSEERCGLTFVRGRLSGQDAVVVRAGIGKVNAAACTQLLIDRYGAGCIINTGIAGSLSAAIDIGDIVVSTDAVQYDMDATGFGYAAGEVPRIGTMAFPASEELLILAEEENRRVNPEIRTHRGRILTGDCFVSDDGKKRQITDQFGGLCCEMEGAAVAQIAYLSKVPFLILRAISDKADGSALVDYADFEKQAIRHSVRLVQALAGRLAQADDGVIPR